MAQDHGDWWLRADGNRRHRDTTDDDRRNGADGSVAADGQRGRGAVGSQRAWADRRPQDHLVRGQRDRLPIRPRPSGRRGDLREHAGSIVRGHRQQHRHRRRRRTRHAICSVGMSSRGHPRAVARVDAGSRGARRTHRHSRRGFGSLPDLHEPRRSSDRLRRLGTAGGGAGPPHPARDVGVGRGTPPATTIPERQDSPPEPPFVAFGSRRQLASRTEANTCVANSEYTARSPF